MVKAVSAITKPLNKLGPIGDILTAVGLSAIPGGAAFIPAVQGLKAYGATGNVLSGLAAGAGSYLGGKFGGNVFGDLGTVGGAATNTFGNEAGNSILNGISGFAGNAAGDAFGSLATTPISSIAGSYAGNALGQAAVGAQPLQAKQKSTAFSPTRAGEGETPASLQAYGSLSPDQQTSNLATQGVYGGGLAPQEQQYFLNLVNRQLIPQEGGVQDKSSLNPIENSYLSQLGLGGYQNSNDLLEAISKWKAA